MTPAFPVFDYDDRALYQVKLLTKHTSTSLRCSTLSDRMTVDSSSIM